MSGGEGEKSARPCELCGEDLGDLGPKARYHRDCYNQEYERARSGADRTARPSSQSVANTSIRLLRKEGLRYPEQPGVDYQRPRVRGDCLRVVRPCPFVSCAMHLYLEVGGNGTIKYNFPDKEVWELQETCALDVAERDEYPTATQGVGEIKRNLPLEEVAPLLNITREALRLVEKKALVKLLVLQDTEPRQ